MRKMLVDAACDIPSWTSQVLRAEVHRKCFILERKMESGRLAQDLGRMRFASSARSTNKVQLRIPQTASTTVFYAILSLSIFLSRFIFSNHRAFALEDQPQGKTKERKEEDCGDEQADCE